MWLGERKDAQQKYTCVLGEARINNLKGYEITHTKIKCWEVSRVSGMAAKLERRLKRG
jgi:hypothetical protein